MPVPPAASCMCGAGRPAREFDRMWPAGAPFPPRHPWLAAGGPRAGLRKAYIELRKRHGWPELVELVERGEWRANSPLVVAAGALVVAGLVVLAVVVIYMDDIQIRSKHDDDAEEEEEDTADEDSGDTDDSGESSGSTEGGFWDGPDSGGCPPYTLC